MIWLYGVVGSNLLSTWYQAYGTATWVIDDDVYPEHTA